MINISLFCRFSLLNLACVLAASTSIAQISGTTIDGEWIDERDAKLELAASGSQITGTYTPKLISADCLGGNNSVFGVYKGDIISLSVVFEKCDAILNLIGQVTDGSGVENFYASWISSRDIPDQFENQALWASFSFGTSTFVKQ